jgi:hypothetical protein
MSNSGDNLTAPQDSAEEERKFRTAAASYRDLKSPDMQAYAVTMQWAVDEIDRLRMAIIAWRFLDSVDEYQREAALYEMAARLIEALPGPDVMPSDAVMAAALLGVRVDVDGGF